MRLHVTGQWPEPMLVKRGWSLAQARPWNDDAVDVSLRLTRGTSGFLVDAAQTVAEISGGTVYSPALYPTATQVWEDASFREHVQLDIMQRRLDGESPGQNREVRPATDAEATSAAEIDDQAFEGFWRIGDLGIKEAMAATNRSILLVADTETGIAGYAVVGAHLGRSFLQRIAVRPMLQGRGFGRSLLARSMEWASGHGAVTMMLNLRPENRTARGFYERAGFVASGEHLVVLRFD